MQDLELMSDFLTAKYAKYAKKADGLIAGSPESFRGSCISCGSH